MPVLLRRLPLPLLAAISLALPATAMADGASVIRDCTDDGRLAKPYKQSEYRDALANLPTDVDEYTDCRDVIRNAQLGAAGGGGGPGGGAGAGATGAGTAAGGFSGGGTGAGGAGAGASGTGARNADEVLATATPRERQAVEAARAKGRQSVRVGDQIVDPGALGFGSVGAVNSIPSTLVVVLVLLALVLGAAGGQLVRTRVIARRPAS